MALEIPRTPYAFKIKQEGSPSKSEKLISVTGEMAIGRSESCQIRLDHPSVSRRHALLRIQSEGALHLENQSEFAPLRVNGIEGKAFSLALGDQVLIGPFCLELFQKQGMEELSEKSQPERQKRANSNAEEEITSGEGEPPPLAEGPVLEPSLLIEEKGGEGESPILALSPTSSQGSPFEDRGGVVSEGGSPFETASFREEEKTNFLEVGHVSFKFIFEPGEANVIEYEMKKGEVLVGRGKDCDLILSDKKASRKNSILKKSGTQCVIEDLNSSNGTYVNEERTLKKILESGDWIRIGTTQFQFKAMSQDYDHQQKDFLVLPPEEFLENAEPSLLQEAPLSTPLGGEGGVSSDLAGIAGMGAVVQQKKTLLERFKALPPKTRIPILIAGIALAYWLFLDEDPPSTKDSKKDTRSPASQKEKKEKKATDQDKTFEALSLEQKTFVESQHSLAFDLYKNKEYDRAIFEIQKIFSLVSDYKDAKEIVRYATEGKKMVEAFEKEKQNKEKLERNQREVAELIDEVRAHMEKKEYEEVEPLFARIYSIDPEYSEVALLKQQIQEERDKKAQEEQQKKVQESIHQQGLALYHKALETQKKGKYQLAIQQLRQLPSLGLSDSALLEKAKKRIEDCLASIRHERDPFLQQAQEQEAAGKFSEAYQLYEKATRVDPHHPEGFRGMSRIRGVLHEKAKAIYTEAVLVESYGDFDQAKSLYQKCLEMAPKNDLYAERCGRKKALYFDYGGRSGSDSSSPPVR